MSISRIFRLRALFFSLVLPNMVFAATVYETQAEFLDRAFNHVPPDPGVVWISGDRKSAVHQMLGHDYPALRIRYWCRDMRSAWILEEVGKDLPITVGVVIVGNYIESLRVLMYRENRGGEVATPSFTEQFNGSALDHDNTLDAPIDGITGATLSVRALSRLATLALYLESDVGCKDGS
ncbi:FMN-binding protein [Pseudomonadota bacterium]